MLYVQEILLQPLRPWTEHNYGPWGGSLGASDWDGHMRNRLRAPLGPDIPLPPSGDHLSPLVLWPDVAELASVFLASKVRLHGWVAGLFSKAHVPPLSSNV